MKLSQRMTESRTDRLDEWSMDDVAREAKQLEDRIIELEDKIKKLEFMVENGLGYEDLQRDI